MSRKKKILVAGAAAVLATRPVPAPAVIVADVPAALAALARFVVDSLPAARIAGITGSSGKTTTKDIAAQLIERLGPTIAPAGSYNNEFGLPLTVLRADAATRYLVLELSARGIGHIAHLCGIAPPRYGVVQNVGRAHAGDGIVEQSSKCRPTGFLLCCRAVEVDLAGGEEHAVVDFITDLDDVGSYAGGFE